MLKFWIAGYILLLATTIAALLALRSNIVSEMGTPTAEAQWNRWRAEAAKEDGSTGPVQRTVPKSNQPPLLILMRDYFAASLIGLLLPLSALYWFIAWLIRGVTRQTIEYQPPAGIGGGGTLDELGGK